MASKTFLQLQNDALTVADETSGSGSTTARTIVKAGINESYSEIAGVRDWKTLENNTTVSATSGDQEYTPVTASGTVCRIRRIQSVLDETNNKYLEEVKREVFEQQYPYVNTSSDTGTPTIWYLYGYDTSRNPVIRLYKVPNSSITYRVIFYEEPLELSVDTDVPRIPDQFHYGLTYLGLAKYYEFQKESLASYYRGLHEDFKRKILTIEYGVSDDMPVMRPEGRGKGWITGKLGRVYNG